jgi:hypothetical protein
MDELIVPIVDKGLLDYLQRLHPDVAPESNQTDRDIWINRGAVGVVRHLIMLHTEQTKNILGDNNNVFR